MQGVDFPEANVRFGPPPGFAESQVRSVRTYKGQAMSGSCEGTPLIVVAHKPSPEEIEKIVAGAPIFVTFMSSGLPPHMLTTSFPEAISPA